MTHARESIADLRSLARAVISGDLCSLLFPVFVTGFQEDTGHEPTGELREIARRIRREHESGIHRTPREIADILRARADELERRPT